MMVVKIGGGRGVDLDAVCADAASLIAAGERLVIVHGGSDATNELSARLGVEPRFIESPSGHTSRRTDRATLAIFQMACRGVMNQGIVERLQGRGVRAMGLSGMDGRIWEGRRKDSIRAVENGRTIVVRDDFTGSVDRVNAALLRVLLDHGCTPVLSPPAISIANEAINVDADRAAARTAAALGARSLLLLSNVPGLLRAFPDESTLIPRIARSALDEFDRFAQGRMKKKLLGAREALDGGVPRVVIGDGRGGPCVSRAAGGAGTVIE